MFMKAILAVSTNDKDYRNVLKKRRNVLYVMMILGIVTLIFDFIFSVGKYAYLSDFLSGVYTGVGAGLIISSCILLVKNRMILKDENKLKQKKLEEQDERNQMIIQKAMYTSAIILMIFAYLGLMVAGIFNLAVFWTLWVVVIVFMLVFILLNMYYNKVL